MPLKMAVSGVFYVSWLVVLRVSPWCSCGLLDGLRCGSWVEPVVALCRGEDLHHSSRPKRNERNAWVYLDGVVVGTLFVLG